MKKIKKNIKLLRDIITIVGIPAIGILGWNMHNEQIKLKDDTIDLKDAQIEFLKTQSSPVVIEKYNQIQNFMDNQINSLNDSIQQLKKSEDNNRLRIKQYQDSIESLRISKLSVTATWFKLNTYHHKIKTFVGIDQDSLLNEHNRGQEFIKEWQVLSAEWETIMKATGDDDDSREQG